MTLVLLASLSAGVLQDQQGNVLSKRQVNVYARGTSTPVQVYSDSAGSSPVTQPLTTDSSGNVPGYVAGGVSIDIVDVLTGLREQGEPVSANAVARTIATTYLTPSGGDDSAAMVTALAAGGTIAMGPGTFLWNTSVPAFKRSTPTRVVGAGVGKTIIKLSTGAPRAFDFGKVADYDTFSDIEITDLTIDVNNVGGQHHVVLGTYVNGTTGTKINVVGLALKRLRTINVPTDPTVVNHRLNVWIFPLVNVADNPCVMTDVVLEDCDFTHGGNIGVGLGGSANDGFGNGNLIHDRIELTRVSHDTLLPNAATAYSSFGIQIGSRDTGLNVILRDCHSYNSGDVGIALLNSRYGTAEDCSATDATTGGFQAGNFNPNLPADQTHVFRRCRARNIVLNPINGGAYAGSGYYMNGAPNQQLGHVILENCSWYSLQTNCPAGGMAISCVNPIRSLQILGEFKANATSVSHTLAANYVGGLVSFASPGSATFQVRGALRSNVAGAITLSGHTFSFQDVQIRGLASSSYVLDVDAHCVNYGLTGVTANTFTGCLIGPTSVLSPLPAFSGRYRMVVESHTSADTGPRGIITQPYYLATPQITVNGALTFPNCDFAQFPAGSVGQEIVIDASTVTFADVSLAGSITTIKIFYPGIIPANGGVMPLQAGFAIAATSGPIMNLAGVRRKILFTGNMPTAVTFQRRADTTPFALANSSQVVYDLEPGDRLNVTFAGSSGNTYNRIPAVL